MMACFTEPALWLTHLSQSSITISGLGIVYAIALCFGSEALDHKYVGS